MVIQIWMSPNAKYTIVNENSDWSAKVNLFFKEENADIKLEPA